MNGNMSVNSNFSFLAGQAMKEILIVDKGAKVMGAWGKDDGTKVCKLKLALVYPNGEVSPIRSYPKSKLTSSKAIQDLTDLDGVRREHLDQIMNKLVTLKDKLPVQTDGSGKCSMTYVYSALCSYVRDYEEPRKVFIRDGYGNIQASYLQTVLDRLDLGYSRHEVEQNLSAWSLLRANPRAGHPYSYAINLGQKNDWFFSFKLPDMEEEVA